VILELCGHVVTVKAFNRKVRKETPDAAKVDFFCDLYFSLRRLRLKAFRKHTPPHPVGRPKVKIVSGRAQAL
jgi:hypothetical protein